ncbi:LOW QUALITY PROTEIN: Olfactory receptor 14J1 [Galemys pyrenaicus]|uniref:Olfactory receptor 14J1 n=1 Tax=Galemys pyrenaicus TaxID=202257 RepID=A0A8J6A1W6_GALPY|nr:LOW QUALITY PROTEIN: Olfactory receptor 14J1 [Galemys pyrenaicus]
MANFTVSGFLLMGFSDKPELELIHASLFLVLYVMALTGNILTITAISLDNSLQSPMYFFLKHLSFLDLFYISVTVPRSIYNFFMHNGYISLGECIVQCFAFTLCAGSELSMLTVMSYDRYVAICLPLRYEIIMDVSKCVHSVLGVWISGVIAGAMHTAGTFSIHFCGSHVIHQFFCDISQLLKLSCSNEYINEFGVSAFLSLMALPCIFIIGLSYTQIFSTVLRMPSAEGRAKAFSTCLPHLVVVILFVSTSLFEFFQPPSDSPRALDIFLTIMYTVVPPTLNPMIYSLRNQAMKAALRNVFQRRQDHFTNITGKLINMTNFTMSGFLLVGFSTKPEIEILLASLFLVTYVVALTGNFLIIIATSKDNSLQSPMYFFLKQLSFLDLFYISVTVPRSIYNCVMHSGYISLKEYMVQCFGFVFCAAVEISMLTVMSYDHYVAIYLPLCYEIIMDVRKCVHSVLGAWISGVISGVMHTAATFSVHFCGSHVIHQFFCDIPQLLKISCASEYISEVWVTAFLSLMAFLCVVFIGLSHIQIFSTVLRMPSAEGRAKAFSTCLPHLAVVILFISTGFFEYLKPPSDSPSALDIFLTIMYIVVPPTLNPMIYSLRNQAIKTALRKPELELVHASVFFVLYLVALTGNLLIITAISMDHSLHSPMYFFLKHLSFLDLCYISVTVPRSICNSLMHDGYISLWECIVQCFAFTLFAAAELSMLSVMSYDRYVAICHPLRYEIIMDVSKCVHSVLGVWISGVITGTMHTAGTFSIHFCGSHVIHQFFCDIPQLLKLSCSNEYVREVKISAFLAVVAFLSVTFIGLSYIQIFSTVLRMPSAEGRAKAFSTCLPHLAVVMLLISTSTFEFLKPPSDSPSSLDILSAIMYTVVPPTLNPMIYNLRNQAMKAALRKPELELVHASLFLLLHVVVVTGNLIITATSIDSSLHSPTYFFLKHLSFLDLCYISVTVPESIYNSFTRSGYISFSECIVQYFAFILCGLAELAMLTLISYDHYITICFPLCYEIIMNVNKCDHGVLYVWISVSFLESCTQLPLSPCTSVVPISSTSSSILSTVLRMPSAEDGAKAFSTCLPHLSVIILFISTKFLKPPSDSPSALDIFLTIMYTVVPTTLNPIIYSLRNQAMKAALRKVFQRRNATSFVETLLQHLSKDKNHMANFSMSGFLLMGFSDKPELELVHASFFLVFYMVALTGNILIITATSMDNNLKSPMYFFLKHLSFLDLCYISVTVPRSIYNTFRHSGYISLGECIVQCFVFALCACAELFMLTLMSYDRYVAICLPLRYEIIMDIRTCVHGVLGVWIGAIISGTMHTAATFSVHFCGSHVIQQFFCDIPQLLKLSCSNEYISEVAVSGFVALVAFLSVIFIVLSYIQIFSTVLRMPSAEGRAKAFSTCLPHLAVVILFISTSGFEFLRPTSDYPITRTGKLRRIMANFTMSGFLLMGFSDKPEQKIILASLFLILYMLAVTGNVLIITATSMDNSLHSPMYFFLKHLSFLDLCYISVTVPRSIYNTFRHSGYISLGECIVQCFAFTLCASAELSMLTLMSYGRYVAICFPLRYEIIMDVSKRVHGVLGVWVSGIISGTMHTAATFSMHFCGSHVIHQFFCDIPQLLKLSCSNDYISEAAVSGFVAFVAFLSVIFVVLSYIQIFSTDAICRGQSRDLFHLPSPPAVIILFISTSGFEFLRPPSDYPSALDILLTIMYTVVPPKLNPMIYR